ncbi:MAG TPA: hypothetical protein VFL91_10855 [Thermomicrobiales bacterium]|nr:hypothetical protein [Thermomicrobiales bacterium]
MDASVTAPLPRQPRPAGTSRAAARLTLVGTVVLLLGLGLDALIHRANPTLAEHEGIFTLSNPGHLLFALGILIVIAGSALYLIGALAGPGRSGVRRALAGVAFVGLLALSGVSFTLAAASDGGILADHHHDEAGASGAGTPAAHQHTTSAATGPVTPAQRAAADQLARQVKADTARFADFSAAQAAGYRQVTAYPLKSPGGAYGPAHFLNTTYAVALAGGNYLDTAHPPELVYFRMPDGTMLLLGAMFLAPAGLGPQPGGALTTWHVHDNLCLDGQGMYTAAGIFGRCPAGSHHVADTYEMMHVWTFDDPDGPFAHGLTRADYLAAIRQLDPGAVR